MYLPDSIGDAFRNVYMPVSTVKIYCEDRIKNKVAKYFEECLADEWKKACEEVEEKLGELELDICWIYVGTDDYGVVVLVDEIGIKTQTGYYDPYCGANALDNALENTKEKFQEIEYEGYINDVYSDTSYGETVQWSISSTGEEKTEYDFIGRALNSRLKNEDHIWPEPANRKADDLTFVVTGKLEYFKNGEDIKRYIEELGASVSESVSKKTSYLISNDLYSDLLENIKAKELNVPIITEKEFISRFGDLGEYGITTSDGFWDSVIDALFWDDNIKQYEEVLEVLYAHSEWIDSDVLRRTVFNLIDIAADRNPENKQILLEYVEKLESGEPIEKEKDMKDEFENEFEKEFELAVQATIVAEVYEEELAQDGILPDAPPREENRVVVLDETSYPRISAKAKEGDKRAIDILQMIEKVNS